MGKTCAFATILLALLVSPVQAKSDTQTLHSNEQGWHVEFESPPLISSETQSNKENYRFYGQSGEGFFISMHVEEVLEEQITNQNCRERFINDASQLHHSADGNSLDIIDNQLSEAHYFTVLQKNSAQYRMPNSHFYFTIKGYCADLHFAATPNYDAGNLKSFSQIKDEIRNSLKVIEK